MEGKAEESKSSQETTVADSSATNSGDDANCANMDSQGVKEEVMKEEEKAKDTEISPTNEGVKILQEVFAAQPGESTASKSDNGSVNSSDSQIQSDVNSAEESKS